MINHSNIEKYVDTNVNESGKNIILTIGGPFIYIYENDILIRSYPIQYIKRCIYPGTKGIVLILKMKIDFILTPLVEPIALKGDETVLFKTIERIDSLTYPVSKQIIR